MNLMPQMPGYFASPTSNGLRLTLTGSWTVDRVQALEAQAAALLAQAGSAAQAVLDFAKVDRLDTSGAWLIDRTRQSLSAKGVATRIENLRPEHEILLAEAHYRTFEAGKRRGSYMIEMLADMGESVVNVGRDLMSGTVVLGQFVVALGKTLVAPASFRLTPLVYHLESFAFRSIPIIALINFLVGGILAQQGIYQLRRFGATTYAVDLIGLLVLRELGVFLTSIMIAGRSGSAVTAEIGSMKMRDEIDAMQVMGLRPAEVLIVPRLAALIISMPMLTLVADLAALFGGMLTCWGYAGISPESYLLRLQLAVDAQELSVGLIKAPFMGLVIGLIAAVEGFAVGGSAESLGQRVTASVVKSIFTVIVVDGCFTMFFAAIRY
jgi:phospholipid/cholesterol/gamma-HCH transport system permease protein